MSNLDSQPGAVVIITEESHSQFVVQRKDHKHPIPTCRGRISLFGGSKEAAEDGAAALERELDEELDLSKISLLPVSWRSFHLPGNQYAGSYELEAFVCTLSGDEFTELARQIVLPGVVLEGTGEVINREALLQLLSNKDNFVASLEMILSAFLKEH